MTRIMVAACRMFAAMYLWHHPVPCSGRPARYILKRFTMPRSTPYPLLVAVALLALWGDALLANMANPLQPGSAAGEPVSTLDSMYVRHERLVLDLRPLANHGTAMVEATYRIQNAARHRRVPLAFIAVAMRAYDPKQYEVVLDGVPVTGVTVDTIPIASEWRPPATTPALDGGAALRYSAWMNGKLLDGGEAAASVDAAAGRAILFTLELTTGVHTVRVRYAAQATDNSGLGMVRLWQLGYTLAPARRWAGFDSLDAVVLLPAGWEAAASPVMKRAGDSLVGAWHGLPADAIGITTRHPLPSAFEMAMADYLLIVLAGLIAIAAAIFIGRFVGRRLGARGRTSLLLVPPALLAGAFASVLVLASELLRDDWIHTMLGAQRARGADYGRGITAVILGVPAAFIVASLLCLVIAWRAYRRAPRRSEPVPSSQSDAAA